MKYRLANLWQHLCKNSGQCSRCGGWFDNWPGGECDACRATGH